MINADTIKSMVCRTLADNFKEHKIYKNSIKQGIKLPCFFISQINSSHVKIGKGRYKRNLIINIRYECENQNNSKNDTMAFELIRLFEEVNYEGNIYIPKKVSQEDSDGIMQILLYYELQIINEPRSHSKMNSTTLNLNTKGDK